METLLKRISPWMVLVLLLALILSNWEKCKNGGGKTNDDDGPTSGISLVEIQSPIAIAIMDANRLLDEPIPSVTVKLYDPDSMVITPSGHSFSSIEISQGIMSLGLSPEAEPSAEDPYHFFLEVSAEGFSTNYKSVRVTGPEEQYVAIFMSKIETPPVGSASFSGAVSLNAGQVANVVTLTPQIANGIPSNNLRVTIPEKAQPIFCGSTDQGQAFPDSLNFKISYGAPQHLATARTFPGGSAVTQAANLDGSTAATPANPISFTTAGWINLEMDADGAQVNGFTKPLSVSMPIPADLINPRSTEPFVEGDSISVWSLNSSGAWREESITTVKDDGNGLYAIMAVPHLSTWNLDAKDSPCTAGIQDLTISYNNTTGSNINRYSEIIRRSDGLVFPPTAISDVPSHIINYVNGPGNITIGRAPDGVEMDYVVYNDPTAPVGVLASTGSFDIDCSSQPSPSVVIPNSTTLVEMPIALQARDGASLTPMCNNFIWFKECGTCDATEGTDCLAQTASTYSFGGRLTPNAAGTTGQVTLTKSSGSFNNTHCLRLWYTGLDSSGGTISAPLEIPVDFSVTPSSGSPEAITGKLGPSGTSTDVAVEHWEDSGTHFLRVTGGITFINACPPT